MVWKDKKNGNILIQMPSPPAVGKLYNENGKSLKLTMV
jgi:hypothetical protein